jgi:hypothetical protein
MNALAKPFSTGRRLELTKLAKRPIQEWLNHSAGIGRDRSSKQATAWPRDDRRSHSGTVGSIE